jgi:cytochrome P450
MAKLETVDLAAEFAALNAAYTVGTEVDYDPHTIFRARRLATPIMTSDILAEYGIPSQANFKKERERVYTVFKYKDIARALQDDHCFSAGLQSEGLGDFLEDGILNIYTGEEHRRLRGPLSKVLSPSTLNRWRQRHIEPQIRQHLENLKFKGSTDLVNDFSLRFPVDVIYRVLGYPEDGALAERFAGYAIRLLLGSTDPKEFPVAYRIAQEASRSLYDETIEVVRATRLKGADGDDMISFLIRSTDFDDHLITTLLRGLLPAAAETTTRTFGSLLLLLLDHPEALATVRADRSLLNRALTESMRFEPVATFAPRETKCEVMLSGVTIPAGTALDLCTASGNRDEEVFESPDTFDIHRTQKMPMLSFGSGAHVCVGAPVAKLEVIVAINAVLDILPNIRRDADRPRSRIRGLNLRGPDDLFVTWDT